MISLVVCGRRNYNSNYKMRPMNLYT